MKLNKYYTPEIEEFFVGFEYEVFQKGEPYDSNYMYLVAPQENDAWYKFTYPDPFLGNNLKRMFEIYKIRVKYLDKEDIESLGFNQIANDCFNLSIKEYRGRLNQEIRILVRQTILIYLAMDMNYKDKNNLVLFTGNIKNKSELIKLLKQLGIE